MSSNSNCFEKCISKTSEDIMYSSDKMAFLIDKFRVSLKRNKTVINELQCKHKTTQDKENVKHLMLWAK